MNTFDRHRSLWKRFEQRHPKYRDHLEKMLEFYKSLAERKYIDPAKHREFTEEQAFCWIDDLYHITTNARGCVQLGP